MSHGEGSIRSRERPQRIIRIVGRRFEQRRRFLKAINDDRHLKRRFMRECL